MLSNVVDQKFPKWAKILLCIFGDAACVYRLFNFIDDCIAGKQEKRVIALVGAILCLIPFVGLILGIIDIVSLAKSNAFSGLLR